MIGRRALVTLCTLSICSLAAQSAMAVTKSTTAFTCKEVAPGTGGFTDSSCKTEGTGNYGHVAIAANTTTELKSTNEGPIAIKSAISGIEVEMQSAELIGTGKITNTLSGKEHIASGTETLAFKKVTVTKPVGKGCAIKGGEFTTPELKATTAGAEMGVTVEPVDRNADRKIPG